MRRRTSLATLAMVVLVLLAGCGGSPRGSSSASPAAPAPVSQLTSVPATPSPTAAPSPSSATRSGVPAALRGTDWTHLPTTRKVVALTFDGGASDTAVGAILRTLETEDVPATFFLTGDFARRFPAQVQRIAAAGHVLGNHSNTHPDFTTLTNSAIRAQLSAASSAIRAASGARRQAVLPVPVRGTYGGRHRLVNAAGYVPVRWTVDTLGWKGTSGGITAQVVVDRVLTSLRAGQIVLMHVGANPDDGSTLDAEALPRMIKELRARGYAFVTLRAML